MEENKQNQALNEEELKQVHGGIATEITALSDYLFGWECPTPLSIELLLSQCWGSGWEIQPPVS